MSKSIQDYRNIVKVLKLQLLKTREENASLYHQLGIPSEYETQHSSFTPKINHYKQSSHPFAQKIVLFLEFAHRCQLVGITPEMIFRIADKKRDKKISVNSFAQICKRIKLKMPEDQVSKLLSTITKGNSIFYDEYLEFLSAFQINSQKFPPQSARTFIQLCLIKFGKQCKQKYQTANQLYKKMSKQNEENYLEYNDLVDFCRREINQLKDIQIVGIFLGLDMQSQCQIEKNTFKRQMDKVYSLIERGIADQIPRSKLTVSKPQSKIRMQVESEQEKDNFKEETETGVEKFNKKPVKKQAKKQMKIQKGSVKGIEGELKKKGLSVGKFIDQLLKQQNKELLTRSFSLGDISNSLKALKKDFPKKQMIKIFKFLDKDGNGSASTEELIKIWIRCDDNKLSNNSENLFKLLNRHLRQIQFNNPISAFINLGYKPTEKLTEKCIGEVFEKIQLSTQQVQFIASSVGMTATIQNFADLLKSQGKPKTGKSFVKMPKTQYEQLYAAASKLCKNPQKARFKKLIRLQDDEQSQGAKYWQTIFTNQWACLQFCIKTASRLQSYWRDPEFGPTPSDQHGYRSIVGNESQVPPGLPDEEQIQWITYEELLAKKSDLTSKVTFMKENLQSIDVVQGKLGNCWYVSALSIIANDDEYIRGKPIEVCQKDPSYLTYGIHPRLFHQFRKYGLYVFKFFKKFKPIYVVVDELFPVETSTNDLIFAKSPQNGLQWVSFAEKAYAKLHHTYSNMISGDIAQGLNDLTNTLPIKENLKADDQNKLKKIIRLAEERQLMGCSISAPKGTGVQHPVELDGERCGLFYGHAYSIIDYLNLITNDNKFDLMRVRNPWGHGEWILDWSDQPADDNPQYKSLEKYQKDLDKYYEKRIAQAKKHREEPPVPYKPGDDGQFLITFQDWSSIFNNLFTGLSFRNEKQYTGQFILDRWDRNTPSGLCKAKGASQADQINFVKNNHQYIIQIKQPTDILMFVIQEDGRLYRGEKYPYKELVNAVIILVFKLENNQRQLTRFDKSKMNDPNNLKLEVRRDVDYWDQLQPGRYAVVPCKNKNKIQETEFQFRIYSNKQINVKKARKGNNSFSPLIQETQNIDRNSVSSLTDYLKGQNSKF